MPDRNDSKGDEPERDGTPIGAPGSAASGVARLTVFGVVAGNGVETGAVSVVREPSKLTAGVKPKAMPNNVTQMAN